MRVFSGGSPRQARFEVALLTVFGLLVAPAIFATLVLMMAGRQNAIANAERLDRAESLIRYFAATSEYAVDYNAHAPETYQAIVQRQDFYWFELKFGAAQYRQMPQDATLVVDGVGKVFYGSWRDERVDWSPSERLGPIYQRLFDEVRTAPASVTRGSFARVDDQLAFVAMSEIGPLDRTVGKVDAYRNFMLFVYFFDAAQIASLRDTIDWSDLDVRLDAPEGDSAAILDAGGAAVAHLTWDFPRHGQQALRDVGPALGGAFFLAALSAAGLAFRVARTNRRLEAARREAVELACRDPLTGLLNRRALAIDAARLLADGAGIHALLIDLDGFKEVNDRFGHRQGDALLVEMGLRMQRLLPGDAVLARTGGDEFAILLTARPDEAMEVGRDLVMAIAAPLCINGEVVGVSASVGVAGAQPGVGPDELLRRADVAMYAAKTEGSGLTRAYGDQLDAARRAEFQLDAEMRAGLARGEFWVAYQPLLCSATGDVVGVEALARWNHPERGPIAPGVFIPIAERSRFIIELGDFILRSACRRLADDGGALALSVNLSPAQMLDFRIVDRVAAILAETGLAPQRLELEVTEGYLIEQEARATQMLNRLRDLGVRISLDDFGCGYASLGYLRTFPLDKVKIDRSFVIPIESDAKARAVLAAVVSLCQAFELKITAEGVETPGQAAFLRRIGCDRLQGFLFGKPDAALPGPRLGAPSHQARA